jgi:hypothetical protein
MPGTLVTDANAISLLQGVGLAAAATTTSTIVQLDRPGDVIFRLALGTVTGTSPTFKAVIQGCDTADFSTGSPVIVSYGTINSTGTGTAQSNTSHQISANVYHRYVRSIITIGGTSPVYTGATLTTQQEDYLRTRSATAD